MVRTSDGMLAMCNLTDRSPPDRIHSHVDVEGLVSFESFAAHHDGAHLNDMPYFKLCILLYRLHILTRIQNSE